MCKIIPKYLTDLVPKREIGYNIRNRNKPFFKCRTESFKNSFSQYTIEAWFSLHLAYPNTLPILFLNVKLVTILEIEISPFLNVELKVLKIHSPNIPLRLGLVYIRQL